jgi:uncharacterized membrane protein
MAETIRGSTGVLGLDARFLEVLLDDRLGRRREVVLQRGDLALELGHPVGQPLHACSLEGLVELGQLELDADGMVFESWIRHGARVPVVRGERTAPYAPRSVTVRLRMTIGATVGVAVGAAAALIVPWQAAVLLGWDAGAAIFLGWVLHLVTDDDVDVADVATRDDPNRLLASVLLVVASVGCLVGVVLALVKAKQAEPNTAPLIVLAVLSVLVSWAVVHSVYLLHYARLYYAGEDGGIEFEGDPPRYIDFAYLAFTVGMTYQVSDTGLTNAAMRRHALGHALLSFLFGTFILALTINVLAGSIT